MTEAELIVGLTFAGASCELVGIALIVKEIASDRALAREVLASAAASTPATQEEPPIRSRGPLSRLLGIDFDEIAQVTNKQLRDALAEATTRLIDADLQRDHALRRFLHRELGGSIASRLLGVGFFVAGIVLTAGAQILQVGAS